VPQHKAIDFVYRNKFLFSGDSILMDDGILQNFHLKPARINLQLDKKEEHLPGLQHKNNYWKFFDKRIIMVDSAVYYEPHVNKLKIDLLIISKNPSLRISAIAAAIRPSVVVFDASNSLWKIANWKKECLILALPCFSIPEQGAYVLNIE
jgi:competence protein ComEC